MSVGRLAWVSFAVLALCSVISLELLNQRTANASGYPLEFLSWNLTLAWVPFVMAVIARAARTLPRAPAVVVVACFGALWLLFLPNAPYIVTDAIHLEQPGVVWPDDAVLVGAFAATALGLGVVSLRLMHDTVHHLAGRAAGWTATFGAVAASAVGVWLGRVWRWNSWDVFTAPRTRLIEATGALQDPSRYLRSMTLAIGVSVVFLIAYLMLFAVTPAPSRERNFPPFV